MSEYESRMIFWARAFFLMMCVAGGMALGTLTRIANYLGEIAK